MLYTWLIILSHRIRLWLESFPGLFIGVGLHVAHVALMVSDNSDSDFVMCVPVLAHSVDIVVYYVYLVDYLVPSYQVVFGIIHHDWACHATPQTPCGGNDTGCVGLALMLWLLAREGVHSMDMSPMRPCARVAPRGHRKIGYSIYLGQ